MYVFRPVAAARRQQFEQVMAGVGGVSDDVTGCAEMAGGGDAPKEGSEQPVIFVAGLFRQPAYHAGMQYVIGSRWSLCRGPPHCVGPPEPSQEVASLLCTLLTVEVVLAHLLR